MLKLEYNYLFNYDHFQKGDSVHAGFVLINGYKSAQYPLFHLAYVKNKRSTDVEQRLVLADQVLQADRMIENPQIAIGRYVDHDICTLNVNGNTINAYALEINSKSLRSHTSNYSKADAKYKRVDSYYYVPAWYVSKKFLKSFKICPLTYKT